MVSVAGLAVTFDIINYSCLPVHYKPRVLVLTKRLINLIVVLTYIKVTC